MQCIPCLSKKEMNTHTDEDRPLERKTVDIEELHTKYQSLIHHAGMAFRDTIDLEDVPAAEALLKALCEKEVCKEVDMQQLKRQHGLLAYKNSALLRYARTCSLFEPFEVASLGEALRISRGKSHSGVLVITVFTSAYPEYVNPVTGATVKQPFSCKWNCHYCPNQPGQPRSYLEGEPGVLRANSQGFDCCRQMWSRMEALYNTGHPIDKLEVLVLGGTWESYPRAYRDTFIRDIYYAANTFWEVPENRRIKASLAIERDCNRDQACKVIGLTLETRPDTIDEACLRTLRKYGCTRVQIGIQHLNDAVLTKINRQCPTERTVAAIHLLKSWGFKVDAHWMPNLPGSTVALDRDMFLNQLLALKRDPYPKDRSNFPQALKDSIEAWWVWEVKHPEFQADQWKIYPCEVVPYTEIERWYHRGEYTPYGQEDMTELLLETKRAVFPWIRLNRIIRDIPSEYILASGDHPSLRQELLSKMKKRGWVCRCIRCREIKGAKVPEHLVYRVQEYPGMNGAVELFLSCEDKDAAPDKDVLCGFARIRIPGVHEHDYVHDEHEQTRAWIRELHVYGILKPTTQSTGASERAVQSTGIGRRLMVLAEGIARAIYGKKEVWVIAGEGTKRYYEKLGYAEGEMGYMIKELKDPLR